MSNQKKLFTSIFIGFICLIVFAGITPHPSLAKSSTQTTTPVPLTCSPILYQVISGQLKNLDFTTGAYLDVGDASGFNNINAMGYNVNDNFLYALPRENTVDVNGNTVSSLDIIKIDANGDVFYHLTPNAPIINSVVADVVDNVLWILNGADIYKINLISGDVEYQAAESDVPIVDWGYIDGKFYGARNNLLYVVDPSTNPASVSSVSVSGLNGTSYGAAYVFGTDELFVSSNTGGLYQILGYNTATPQAFYISNSEVTSSNDGASCAIATFEPPPPPPPSAECGPEDVDTDGDGVIDSIDLDNDNDGILDIVEQLGSPVLQNPDFELYDAGQAVRVFGSPPNASFQFMEGDVVGWETTAPDNQIEIWQSGHLGVIPKSGNAFAEINSSFDARMIQDFDTSGGELLTWSIWHRGRAGIDSSVALIGAPGSTLTVVETMETSTVNWVNYTGAYRVPIGQTRTRLAFESVSTGSGNASIGNFLDAFEILKFIDTDQDGIPDGCDLDSDNDGISDLVESGPSGSAIAADSNQDGTISPSESAIFNGGIADNDVDGLMDIFDNNTANVEAGPSAGTTPVNNDGSDKVDFLDLDSDNDGIPDAIEAQLTNGYINNFPTDNNVTDDDSDGDGVIDIYDSRSGVFGGSFNEPQNTDGDDLPDYLDTDSDNDTKPDSEEHGLEGEGGGPANPTYADPNGRVDDPQTTLQNESGDNSEVAYREIWTPPQIDPDDKDGDGVPNTQDIDDDNDGILDINENIDLDGITVVEMTPGRAQGMGSEGHLMSAATNSCPGSQVAVALYGGSATNGMVGPNSVDSINNGICVQLINANDWASMSVADFQTFDVLWIGNDDCSGTGGAAAFNQAVASRGVWETAIDPGNLMVAGGDYDWHYFRNGGGSARGITEAMIKESSDGPAPGLVLQAGCYSLTGGPWFQNLGGTFEGLFHGGVGAANPGPTDVTSHEFNTTYGWTSSSYQFGWSCHGGMYIAPGSPVEQYNLQVLFYYPGGVVPCFMMSDERFPPFFPTRDTDNDSIPDACDLDSDNDGISDLIESGATAAQIAVDINKDGTISPLEVSIATGGNPDADGDGLMDIFDSDITDPSSLGSIGTVPVNSDADIRQNYIDLDSDSDGIPDVIEGKPTKNFGPTFGNDGDVRDDDIDTDGAISVFDTNDLTTANFGGDFPLPEDTDDDGTPDYLDLDSDNDFALDEWESGLILNGSDTGDFADGLDDLVNPSEFYQDNNGIVDLPWRDLNDEDNNAETDGDVDFREFNPEFDRGDAPSDYGEATNSISEFVELWMGFAAQRPDEDENPFAAGIDALADDITENDDENGVTWNGSEDPTYDTGIVFYPKSPTGFGPLDPTEEANDGRYSFDVDVYIDTFETGFLDVWIDYNGNRQFDNTELVQSQVVQRSNGSQQRLEGLEFVVPDDAACGRSYARFRFSNEPFGEPTGYGGWGEVEDHAITIDCRTDLEVEMTFEPNDATVNGITLGSDRTYRGDWELSHAVAIRTFVKNNGPQAARGVTITIQIPEELDDVAQNGTGRWVCTISTTNLATCSDYGMRKDTTEQVFEFTARIPGNFAPNSVIGHAEVDHEGDDSVPSNNRVDHEINVTKVWEGVEDVEPFLYARFSEQLTITDPDTIDRDIEMGDRVATPIQVPVFYGAGVEQLAQPILRTRWCNRPENLSPLYPGCGEESDYILGTVAVQSHTTISVTQMIRQTDGSFEQAFSGTNWVTAPITTTVARNGLGNPIGRYAEADYADCDLWIGRENGLCVAKQETINSSTMTDAEKALYEWDWLNLTPVVFQTAGGRAISCDNGDGECVYIENATPGVFLLEGYVSYEVVFYDEGGIRLGTDLYKEGREKALSFFIQVIAPFVEPDQ